MSKIPVLYYESYDVLATPSAPPSSIPCQGGQKCVQLRSSPWCSAIPRKRDHCHADINNSGNHFSVWFTGRLVRLTLQCVRSMVSPKPSGRDLCDDLVMPVVAWRRLFNTTTMNTTATATVLLLWRPRWLSSTLTLQPPLATLPVASTPHITQPLTSSATRCLSEHYQHPSTDRNNSLQIGPTSVPKKQTKKSN